MDVVARDLAEQRVVGASSTGGGSGSPRERSVECDERALRDEQRAHAEASAREQAPHHVATLGDEEALVLEQLPLAQLAVGRDARIRERGDPLEPHLSPRR